MNLSLKEKVFGAIYGYAIGDALGLCAEFMTKRELKRKYPEGLTSYSQIVRDAHRAQWDRGDWTNDTSFIVMLIDSICECNRIYPKDFARRLHKWYLSDPNDVTQTMRWVLSQPDFADEPFATSRRVWNDLNSHDSPCDAIGRAIVTGMWNEDVVDHAIDIVRLTHPTTRCETSSAIIAKMANSLMWENRPAEFDDLMKIARNYNVDVVRYLEIARDGILEDINLDDPDNFWFVRKAMAAALWCVWHCESAEEGIIKVINQGGDADTNAALAGGLLGIRYGYSSLPERLITPLLRKDVLDETARKYTNILKEQFMPDETMD